MNRAVLSRPVSAAKADPVEVLRERAWARAFLFAIGELDLHEAVDVLQRDAERDGLVEAIGQDKIQEIISRAFMERCRDESAKLAR